MATPDHNSLKRKAEIDDNPTTACDEPAPKRIKSDETKESEVIAVPNETTIKFDHGGRKRWDVGMDMPEGKPRPTFIFGESEENRKSGSGTVEDPMVVWLGKIPLDTEVKEANEAIARQSAGKLEKITHIYIRGATRSIKFVDRDSKRIEIWNPDNIFFKHRKIATDTHISLAFGTDADNLVLYGYIHVDVDEKGKPTGFATSRSAEHIEEGDDRILELFVHDDDHHDCRPYCSSHASNEALIDACEHARARRCPFHGTEGLIDHWCRQPRRPCRKGQFKRRCPHNVVTSKMDHWCPFLS